jgi:NAD(P)-dependent dehydrogenase (short-subunit alcohol dehydrogenase family)
VVISNLDENPSNAGTEMAGKVALVTGAARGIGNNIARAFANAGATVVIADINAEVGQAAADDLSKAGIASFVHADLSQVGGPEKAIDEVIEQHRRLDYLVNNARSVPNGRRDLESEDEESWDATLMVTLKGTFFTARAALRHWKTSPTAGAAIVNIASISGAMSTHESPAYHAAKGGVIQLTRYLADAGGPLRVRSNAVAPGFIVQDEHRQRYDRDDNETYRRVAGAAHPIGRVGTSDEVAQAVLFLASERSAFINGQILGIDGGSSVQEQWTFLDRSLSRLQ